MRDFKKLDIWQKSYALTLKIYKITKSFPDSKKFSLTNQLRRASSSIGANIAEGCGRASKKDFLRFLYNSYGSVKESEHFILLSKDLDYIDHNLYTNTINDIDLLSKMLNTFIGDISKDIKVGVAQSSLPNAQS
ncbi:MAG: four helix bundle protein [Candidatus Micrarchaeota archaeon]